MKSALHQVSILEDVDGDSVILDLVHLKVLLSAGVFDVQSVNLDISDDSDVQYHPK